MDALDGHIPAPVSPLQEPKRGLLGSVRPRFSVALVVAIGLAVTALAFVTANRAEERRVVKKLEFRTEWRANDLQAKILLARKSQWATAIHVGSEPHVDAETFLSFTSVAAAGGGSIAWLAWAKPVTREGRAKFEAEAGFPILQNGTDGKRVAAAERDDYTPIVFQNRFDNRPPSLGFDMSIDPSRRLAIELARDSGSPRTAMTREGASAATPLNVSFWPIYDTTAVPATVAERRAHLRGYVVGLFRVVDTLNAAIADTPDIPETINFYVSNDPGEAAADSSFRFVATYSPTENTVRAAEAPVPLATAAYSFSHSFDFRGQRWRIESLFSPDAVAAERSVGPLTILIAGLLMTTLLAAYALSGIRRLSVVRTLVGQRTAELRQTNIKLEALIDASPYAIVCLDAERRVILWNAAAERLFGYTDEEIIGQPYPLVMPDEREEFDIRFKRLAAGEVLRNLASHGRHKDGTAIDTSSSAAPFSDAEGLLLGIIFAIEDTRERLRSEEQRNRMAEDLLASGDRFRSIFAAVGEGIFIASATGIFTEVNETGCAMFGYTSDELIGGDIRMISSGVPPYTLHDALGWSEKAMATGRPQRFDWHCKAKDGHLFWAEVSLQFASIGGQDVVLATVRDVTERRAVDAQLRQAQKMEAIGNLTGGMAHDFNNLLGIIIGNLDLLRDRQSSDPDADELTRESLDAALRGADLTRRLLAFARRQPLQPVRTDVNKLIAGIVKLLERTLGEHIQITLDLYPDTWPVVVDPAQLESGLTNLATNARDAMPGGGQLIIVTGNRSLAEVQPGDYAMIEVSDTGTGMPSEVANHIFEPFYTTKEQGKGTGLGLSMVFGFMKQSGGHINVYSEVGIGTTFRLYLRRADPDAEAGAAVLPAALVRSNGETVLAVEDNASLRRVVVRQLMELGYRVLEAEDGQSALSVLESERVDVLFTDIIMPGGTSGFEIARTVLSRWPAIKVVLTSGFPEERINGAADAPNLRLLSKPYRRDDLARIIRDVLDS
jgi:PAS domain S-box-containing protein